MNDQSHITVVTEEAFCTDEPDFKIHVDEFGKIKNLVVNCSAGEDNHTDANLIAEMLAKKDNANILDLGCAGGSLILDLARNPSTNICIGIDGSPGVYKQATWHIPENQQVFRFANLVKPFTVIDNKTNDNVKFDYITCYEVIEHFREDQLPIFFNNVKNHLKEDGVFFGSIALFPDTRDERGFHSFQEGYDPNLPQFVLHKTVFETKEPWDTIMSEFFDIVEYEWNVKMRNHSNSYYFECKLK